MLRPHVAAMLVALSIFILFPAVIAADSFTGESEICRSRSPVTTLCALLIEPSGYPCSEHTTQTKDGYLLGLQRVSSSIANLRGHRGPPVLLFHGLFMMMILSTVCKIDDINHIS